MTVAVEQPIPIPYAADPDFRLYLGDACEVLRELPDNYVDACVTSPPYLDARPDYPSPTLAEFEEIFRELRRVVSGPALINLGRIFRNGCEVRWQEQLLCAAERGGWQHIDTDTWLKPNANPIQGPVLTNSHEYIYLLGRSSEDFNVEAIRTEYSQETLKRLQRRFLNGNGVKGDVRQVDGRKANPLGARPRSYFEACTGREKGNSHPAPMPLEVAERMVKLASRPGQTVIDPFAGSCATALAARKLGRRSVCVELSSEYVREAKVRLLGDQPSLLEVVS